MNAKKYVVIRRGRFYAGRGLDFSTEFPDAMIMTLSQAKRIAEKYSTGKYRGNVECEVIENYGFQDQCVVYQA